MNVNWPSQHPLQARDPIHQDDEGWWFWDETWSDRYGPFINEEAARHELKIYVQNLEEGPDPARDRDFTPPYEP